MSRTAKNKARDVEPAKAAPSADDKGYVHTGLDDPDYDHVDPRTDAEIAAAKRK